MPTGGKHDTKVKPRGERPWEAAGVPKRTWYREQQKARERDNPKIGSERLFRKNEKTDEDRIRAAAHALDLQPDASIDEIDAACARKTHGWDAVTDDRVRAYADWLKDHCGQVPTNDVQDSVIHTGLVTAPAAAASIEREPSTITLDDARNWQQAWDWFDQCLFAGDVPAQLHIGYQRKAGMKGHYAKGKWSSRTKDAYFIAEVVLNPDHFPNQTDAQILQTLVHEMCHCWQDRHGTPGRRGYHNREWADKMISVGLQPSSTDAVGGKETGQQIGDYPIPGDRFEQACNELIATGFRVEWESTPVANKSKAPDRTKLACKRCSQGYQLRPTANLICGDCYDEDRTIQKLVEV